MKYRKFPQSFWQQPNRPNKHVYEDVVEKNEIFQTRTGHIKITSAPDTNLLFSLFKNVKQNSEPIVSSSVGESTSAANNIENNKKAVTEDDDQFKELSCLSDPYMSPTSSKEDCRGLKKSLKSSKNYSELLSDLVVNL